MHYSKDKGSGPSEKAYPGLRMAWLPGKQGTASPSQLIFIDSYNEIKTWFFFCYFCFCPF